MPTFPQRRRSGAGPMPVRGASRGGFSTYARPSSAPRTAGPCCCAVRHQRQRESAPAFRCGCANRGALESLTHLSIGAISDVVSRGRSKLACQPPRRRLTRDAADVIERNIELTTRRRPWARAPARQRRGGQTRRTISASSALSRMLRISVPRRPRGSRLASTSRTRTPIRSRAYWNRSASGRPMTAVLSPFRRRPFFELFHPAVRGVAHSPPTGCPSSRIRPRARAMRENHRT